MAKLVVADYVKYVYNKNGVNKKLIEEEKCKYNCIVSEDWVKRINDNTNQNGFAYIVNEKATKKYFEDSKKQLAERQKKAEIEKALAANVIQEAAKVSLKNLNTEKTE